MELILESEEKIEDNKLNSLPLNEINILGYKYKYKDIYKKGYCYRCVHRNKCKVTILITKEKYNKIRKNNNNKQLQFTINSTQKEHTCNPK